MSGENNENIENLSFDVNEDLSSVDADSLYSEEEERDQAQLEDEIRAEKKKQSRREQGVLVANKSNFIFKLLLFFTKISYQGKDHRLKWYTPLQYYFHQHCQC